MPWRSEIESRGVSLSLRAIPLRDEEQRFGALVLCRDVSELRRREMELVTKDATIREIHHRVKNNLQTVAALLRMQSRRMVSDEAKQGLEQAMRRVATIALVHETLSQGLTQSVDFDELIGRQFRLSAEVASPSQQVKTQRSGLFGDLPSDFATPLALVINELVTNAVEHGLEGRTGTVSLIADRSEGEDGEELLTVTVADDGVGIPETPYVEGLGLQIVRTLVTSELGGSIQWTAARRRRHRSADRVEPGQELSRRAGPGRKPGPAPRSGALSTAPGYSKGRRPVRSAALASVSAESGKSGSAAGAGCAALEGATLVFAHAAPDAGVLAGLECPLQAGVHHRASPADAFGFLDLQEGRAGVSYREKQLRVLVKARCAVTPIHADQSLHSWELVKCLCEIIH